MDSAVKVVYNSSFGGFSLSKLAAIWLAGRGNEEAIVWLAELERRGPQGPERWSRDFYPRDLQRHDPLLVECVSSLGRKSNGSSAGLAIYELKGRMYRLEEYDGSETVVEPDDMKWIEV